MNSKMFKKILLAIENDDKEKCDKLVKRLDPDAQTIKQTNKFLKKIRKGRSFDTLEKVAAVFSVAHPKNITAKRQLAQALIEGKKLASAKRILQRLHQSNISDLIEKSEIVGLLGRVYKQQYVDSTQKKKHNSDLDALELSIKYYKQGWTEKLGDYRWHGINYVALLSHAKNFTSLTDDDTQISETARAILNEISQIKNNELMPWDSGTAFEASIALDDWDQASMWLKDYVNHQDADAFALAGTLRQLREIWRLSDDPEGEKLLAPLEAALLDKEGGTLELRQEDSDNPVDHKTFQAVFGLEGPKFMQWFKHMQARSGAVARIINGNTGEAVGTGFLVDGKDIDGIDDAFKDQQLFITNSHVISNENQDTDPLNHRIDPLTVSDARAEFTYPVPTTTVDFEEIVKYSPVRECDFIILTLKQNGLSREALKPHPRLPLDPNKAKTKQRIFVIGHAQGKELSISLYDNELVGMENQFIHYKSPTSGGSSGSPLLNDNWKLIGLHHAALNDKKVNEGIIIKEIIS